MLDLFIEVSLERETLKKEVAKIEDKAPKRLYFNVGTSKVDVENASTSQILFLSSILESRWRGAKYLGDPELIEETARDRRELKLAYNYRLKLYEANDKLSESDSLYWEIKKLLTFEEKRELFKLNNPR